MDSRSPRALVDTPPVWLAGCVAAAVAQAMWLPLLPAGPVARGAGTLLVIVAVVLFVVAAREFRRHRTSIIPRETPAALLTTGPYGLSRNPIYLADALLLGGLTMRWDLASLPLVAVFVAVIGARFIAGEEAACRAEFGPEWQAYASRVRRWL